MLIGTDISLAECKAMGYTMIKYDGRKKFSPETEVEIIAGYPDYIRENLGITWEQSVQRYYYSWKELLEIYTKRKNDIDPHGSTVRDVDFENPDFHDVLLLADDILFCIGLA